MSHVVIVGGGITGLAAAWELQQHGIPYTLLESSPQLGGKIVTERADGFIIEGGADSFLTAKPWAWQLCHEIGLRERLIGTSSEHRNVYVYCRGQLHLFPRGMRLIVPIEADGLAESTLLSEAGKRRMLAEADIPPRLSDDDESLADFVTRRFGYEALEVFGDSLLSGIHVADPTKLSIAAAFPNYVSLEREYGSLIRGMQQAPPPKREPDAPQSAFVSLVSGMSELIEGLRACLTGDIRIGQGVTRIDSDRTVHTSTGDRLHPDAVLLTTSTHSARTMIADAVPKLAWALAALTTSSSGTVSLGFRREDVEHPLDGMGFVIPRSEPTCIRACTWSSSKLAGRAPESHILIRVFVGGHGRESDIALPDEALIRLARADLAKIMSIQAQPILSRIFRWQDANPQYEVGHLARLVQLADDCPHWLALAGSPYSGIGIPDCVRQGREAAQRVAAALAEPANCPLITRSA